MILVWCQYLNLFKNYNHLICHYLVPPMHIIEYLLKAISFLIKETLTRAQNVCSQQRIIRYICYHRNT